MSGGRESLLSEYRRLIGLNDGPDSLPLLNTLFRNVSTFLSTATHVEKFGCRAVWEVIKSSASFCQEFSAVKAGDLFSDFEQIGLQLIRTPWLTDQLSTIKRWSAFYRYEVQRNLCDADKIFQLLGYIPSPTDSSLLVLRTPPPSPNDVITIAFDCFCAKVELDLIRQIYELALEVENISYLDVIEFREKYCGNVEDCARKLRLMRRNDPRSAGVKFGLGDRPGPQNNRARQSTAQSLMESSNFAPSVTTFSNHNTFMSRNDSSFDWDVGPDGDSMEVDVEIHTPTGTPSSGQNQKQNQYPVPHSLSTAGFSSVNNPSKPVSSMGSRPFSEANFCSVKNAAKYAVKEAKVNNIRIAEESPSNSESSSINELSQIHGNNSNGGNIRSYRHPSTTDEFDIIDILEQSMEYNAVNSPDSSINDHKGIASTLKDLNGKLENMALKMKETDFTGTKKTCPRCQMSVKDHDIICVFCSFYFKM